MSGSTIGQVVGAVGGGVIGFFAGGPAGALKGAAIGYTLGGIVDPPPGPNIEGPRLEDTKITVSTYGNPNPLHYGPNLRTSGNVIWSTGLIETKKTEKQGGKGGGGSSSTTYSYRMSLALMLSGRPGQRVNKLWLNGKLCMDLTSVSPALVPVADDVSGYTLTKSDGVFSVFDEIHFYNGSATQDPDTLIESYEGAGNVPAYRNECYFVLKDLQLADFGNRMPNIEAEFVADESITVAQILEDICDRSGVENASYFGLTDQVEGYSVTRGTGFGAIAPLATAFFFDITEQRGQVRFIKRGLGPKATIPIGDTGAHDADSGPITPIVYDKASAVDLPKQINVNYSDPARDYQTNTQRAFRDGGTSTEIETIELPVVMSADKARQIADRLLWLPYGARRSAKFALSDRYARLNPADEICVPVAGGQVLPHKIQRLTRGDNGITEATVQYDDFVAYESTATGSAGNVAENQIRLPGATELILIDSPIWQDSDDNAGFYWAVTAGNRGWRGAEVFRSSDGGTTYASMSRVGVRTTIGDISGTVPAGPVSVWDRYNTITVTLAYQDDELESVSEEAVLNGANAAWVGNPDGQDGEWLQFATATLIAPLTYELSDLLRGRLGTEANVSTHGPGEMLVMATESSTGRTDYGPGDWDASRLYKPVSILTDLADTAAQSFTNTGAGAKPYSPVHIEGDRDGSNNLTIKWVRRTRYRTPPLGGGPIPLGEASEAYEIDITDGASPATVLRTITATSETASYTAAQQTADGLTPGDPVNCIVYQISDTRGRGFPGAATI